MGGRAWVFAAALVAGMTAKLLLAVGGFAVPDELIATAMRTKYCLRDHDDSILQTI